jgi:hypothetical protein
MKINGINRLKLHRIIEYVKLVGFDYDLFDMEERCLDKILFEDYNFLDPFTKEELQQIWIDLYDLAFQNEIKEVVHLVNLSEF